MSIFDRDLQLGHKRLCHSHMSNLSLSQSPTPPQVALQQEPPDPVEEFLLWQGGVPFLHTYRETQLFPKRQSDRNISTAEGSIGRPNDQNAWQQNSWLKLDHSNSSTAVCSQVLLPRLHKSDLGIRKGGLLNKQMSCWLHPAAAYVIQVNIKINPGEPFTLLQFKYLQSHYRDTPIKSLIWPASQERMHILLY